MLGKRKDAPEALAIFAKMDHGGSGHDSHSSHSSSDTTFDPMTPVKSKVPVKMTSPLNAHPLVADILLSRALSISKRPENETVIIVAHGPVADETNKLWLADMRQLSKQIEPKSNFKRIEYLTVRDDAPEPIRSKATEDLRRVVQYAIDENSSVLIVPLLLSYGGIEQGIKNRLEGLNYTISPQALLPDERITQWILSSFENRDQIAK